MLMKSQNLFISEENFKAASKVLKYNMIGNLYLPNNFFFAENDFEKEINLLKTEKFEDSPVSYYDILDKKNVQKLATLACNENIVQTVKSSDFKIKFPIYSEMIVEKIDKGISRNRDFQLIIRFVNYLSTRKHDKRPKLPFTFDSEMFSYLNEEDVDTLRDL